jgi:hypothetical protein
MEIIDWKIANRFDDVDTDTSDEFKAWRAVEPETCGRTCVGVHAWRQQGYEDGDRDLFVAMLQWENGEQVGNKGHGPTMREALEDLDLDWLD